MLLRITAVAITLSSIAGAQDWVLNPSNQHLYAVTPPLTWHAAQSWARSLGANLVSIGDQAEQDWIYSRFGDSESLWIGLTDENHNGIWTWISGETTAYTNWAPGAPDNLNGVEHWAHITPRAGLPQGANGRWNDSINLSLRAIIETTPRWKWQSAESAPAPMLDPSAAFDPIRGVGVVGGGLFGTDTLEWDGTSWHRIPGSGVSFAGSSLAFDGTGVITVSGGRTSRWTGSTWISVQTGGPMPADGAALAFDPVRRRVVAFGGFAIPSTRNETWEWDGAAWTRLTPPASPPGRIGHALAFHDASGRVVLFGGVTNPFRNTIVADTWIWDGTTWTALSPATSPQARSQHTLVGFPASSDVFLHGGRGTGGDLDDLWAWDGSDWRREFHSGSARARSSHAAFYFPSAQQPAMLVYESTPGSGTPQTQRLTSAAQYRTYRSACPGTCGTPTLTSTTLPRAGQNFIMRVDGICPNSVLFLFFTLDDRWLFQNPNMPLPFDLRPIGAPGCLINVDTAHRQATVMSLAEHQGNPWMDVVIGLPSTPAILGFEFHNQVAVVDLPANALGLVTTNAGHGVVGL